MNNHKDELTESETVVREIKSRIENDHVQPRDIAILFRTNEQPRLFETELRKANIPYVMLGSQSFFDRREVKDILAYLKWIEQPNDEVALLRVINTPARGLGNKTVKLLVQRAVERRGPRLGRDAGSRCYERSDSRRAKRDWPTGRISKRCAAKSQQ